MILGKGMRNLDGNLKRPERWPIIPSRCSSEMSLDRRVHLDLVVQPICAGGDQLPLRVRLNWPEDALHGVVETLLGDYET